MAKRIKNPKSFSEAFEVPVNALAAEGILDPVLNVDTKLFIDPLLLRASQHKEIRVDAVKSYRERFTTLISLLSGATDNNHIGWRTADRLLTFPEIPGTCLGYGAATIRGRSWGPVLRRRVLKAAKQTIDLGVNDPDLFLVIALLEDGIGPDLISDMTTNVILTDLEALNVRLCRKFNVETESFTFKNGTTARFARNPTGATERVPVILVPTDILRELPIVTSWEDVGDAAAKNSALRHRVNNLIGHIWKASVRKKQKDQIRREIYSSKAAFEAILETIRAVPKIAYDAVSDPEGHMAWMRLHATVAATYPLTLALGGRPTIDEIHAVVTTIIEHYRKLVETKGLWKEFWSGTTRRGEKSAQRIFFAVADAYCKANDLDITPEADSGAGPVDFKISSSYKNRVLVELKLSSNSKVVDGYAKQLLAYRKAESTTRASYLVADVGGMGNKDKRLLKAKNDARKRGEPASVLEFVNAKRQKSASKR